MKTLIKIISHIHQSHGNNLVENMKILIACEFSGIVRDAFSEYGHDVWSCDLKHVQDKGKKHIQGDVLNILDDGWDMMIAHPPCTHLSVSGARWFKDKINDGRQKSAIDFFMKLVNAPIRRICIENPVCIMSTIYRKPDQVIQPWMFGHDESKRTCLWLKGLSRLKPTDIRDVRYNRLHNLSPSHHRAKFRSITYKGIANAMAKQWTYFCEHGHT